VQFEPRYELHQRTILHTPYQFTWWLPLYSCPCCRWLAGGCSHQIL